MTRPTRAIAFAWWALRHEQRFVARHAVYACGECCRNAGWLAASEAR